MIANDIQSPGYVLIVKLRLNADAEVRQVCTPTVGRAHQFSTHCYHVPNLHCWENTSMDARAVANRLGSHVAYGK